MLKPNALIAATLLIFCFSVHTMDKQQHEPMKKMLTQRLKEYDKNASRGDAEDNRIILASLERFMQEITPVATSNNLDCTRLVHTATRIKETIEARLLRLENLNPRALAPRILF